MRDLTYAEATREAMQEEMRRDPTVWLLGEDIALQGGIFGQFQHLPQEFGLSRVVDTPISEAAIVGAAVGAALTGTRPVVDIHFADFLTCAMDEVVNQAAKVSLMFGGQARLPLVIRAPSGMVRSAAAQHSQSPEAWFVHTPGLKVVAPSTPVDAKGLLKAAIRDEGPVLYFEHKALYTLRGPVPDTAADEPTPIGQAAVRRKGRDVTIISYSRTVHDALAAAEELAAEHGIGAEVIDLRSLWPWDKATVLRSVRKTRRALIAHEAPRVGGFGGEVAATLVEEAFDDLDAPIVRLGAPHTPIPFSPPLEQQVRVTTAQIVAAVRAMG
jgi:pyruvate dehydrogenase E1 component beta subunit